jgi:hypothetical protein
MTTMQQAAARTSEREAFYARNGGFGKSPLWERVHDSVTARPTMRHWNFQRYLKTLGLMTMVGVSASLAMPMGRAQARGDFSLSCKNLNVRSADFSNTAVLTADCTNRQGHSVGASIDLNNLIADDPMGNMEWASHGHFQQSCRASGIENPFNEPQGHNLAAFCHRADGSEVLTDIDLNQHIANIFGMLKFVP